MPSSSSPVAKAGPEPTLVSRKEVDALYETLQAVIEALKVLQIDYIITGGTLLGAVRQHSILFCDDDIDIAVVGSGSYAIVRDNLSKHLNASKFQYQIKAWEAGDRVRPRQFNNIFVDIFVLREYSSIEDFCHVVGVKKNGQPQPKEYVDKLVNTVQKCLNDHDDNNNKNDNQQQNDNGVLSPFYPFWHFDTRKAIELWPKEVYKHDELFPLNHSYKLGPLIDISGPRMPVTLLFRAFGRDCFHVYYPSFAHQNSNPVVDTFQNSQSNEIRNDASSLPPLVHAGGIWESATPTPLQEEHYIPMQSKTRAKRRHTLHDKSCLFTYLEEQTNLEAEWIKQRQRQGQSGLIEVNGEPSQDKDVNEELECQQQQHSTITVYMDGVFDLFHVGHLKALEQCAQHGDRVIIGVTGDIDAARYKRPPIIPQNERAAIVRAMPMVDQVVCPCPLVVTPEFMQSHGIDLVVHGFANDDDALKQTEFFDWPMRMKCFRRIPYHGGQSTSDIIQKIVQQQEQRNHQQSSCGKCPVHCRHCGGTIGDRRESNSLLNLQNCDNSVSKKHWFGSTISSITNNSPDIPYDPFPLNLRIAIEPHVAKASQRREEALAAIRHATGGDVYDAVMQRFCSNEIEGCFCFDAEFYPLKSILLDCVGLSVDTDLTSLHRTLNTKDNILQVLTRNYTAFQEACDVFVRSVCIPFVDEKFKSKEHYYQAFPCLRIIRPDEFSIGPHADVSYGHHPCSINFYTPLTHIGGSASLFLESRPASQDWRPIEGDYGTIKTFAGSICMHWTTENKSGYTRVSLDFRVIPGCFYDILKCGGSEAKGQVDVYRQKEGYYSKCEKVVDTDEWQRVGPLPCPDARCGFPWTVKDWSNHWTKKI